MKAVGPPLKDVATVPLVEHNNVNQLEVTLTGSLKLIVMFESTGTPEAPEEGEVELTAGA